MKEVNGLPSCPVAPIEADNELKGSKLAKDLERKSKSVE